MGTFEMRKHILTLHQPNPRENTETILRTYELYI
jgi:hypothetical protein